MCLVDCCVLKASHTPGTQLLSKNMTNELKSTGEINTRIISESWNHSKFLVTTFSRKVKESRRKYVAQ